MLAERKSPWGERPNRRASDAAPIPPADVVPDAAAGDTPEGDPPTPAPAPSPAPTPGSDGPRNPWQPAGNDGEGPRRSASIEDIFRNRGNRGGGGSGGGAGGGRGFPQMPRLPNGANWLPLAIAAIAVIGLMLSMFHRLAPQEKAIVTTMGSYSRTLGPGVNFTWPWPIEDVDVEDVTTIKAKQIPEGEGERLILTGDQNLVDLSYLVRWNIKDLKLFKLQMDDAEKAVAEVAEATMRATVAEFTLNQVIGNGRAEIEQRVQERAQRVLDGYRSGVRIQGVEIRKTDPPAKVVDDFKAVSAAQQEAESDMNRARAWAQQVTARAQGDAASFDKVYEQYRLAPDVTRRRMYYETMESVLSKVDKTVVETGGAAAYLPLPQMRQRQRAAPGAAEAAVTVEGKR